MDSSGWRGVGGEVGDGAEAEVGEEHVEVVLQVGHVDCVAHGDGQLVAGLLGVVPVAGRPVQVNWGDVGGGEVSGGEEVDGLLCHGLDGVGCELVAEWGSQHDGCEGLSALKEDARLLWGPAVLQGV